MRIDEQILNRLKEMVKAPYLVLPAEVKEVDRDTLTCTVLPQDGVELFKVRLKAGVEQVKEGLVEIPEIDSSVLVVFIGNSLENAFVAKCSRVEEVLFYGGDHGGLIKVTELVGQLEKINGFLNKLLEALNSPLVAANDGGITLANHLHSQLKTQELPDYSKIENPKVKH